MERVDYESLIISDLLGFYAAKSLDINPWYQRRSVWSTPQKAYLINTIFERKPVPSIYIRQTIDVDQERSLKEVVDGQQRVRTVISYRNDEFPARHPAHKSKVKYSQLSKTERGAFLSTALSVGYLIGADDSDVIEIFGRINSVSKTLNPMEKLNAQFSGEFKQFCLSQAATRIAFWRATGIFSANDISRMQEVQFISDLTINLIQGLSDYSPALIQKYYKDNDVNFEKEDDIQARMESLFSKLAALDPKNFSDTIFGASEVALSLMIVLDHLHRRSISTDLIQTVIQTIDAHVNASKEANEGDEVAIRYISGFAAGNLHRIRARTIRNEVILEAFS